MKKLILTSAVIPLIGFSAEKSSPHLKVKIRLQPRVDAGDIYYEGGFKSRTDLYLRRIRLEVTRKWKDFKLNITLEGDKTERDYDYKKGERHHKKPYVDLKYAYVDWKLGKGAKLLVGNRKKPFSRVSLTSSSRQLLIERPYTTEDAKKWLGDYDAFHLMLHGKVLKGVLRYMFSVSDGSTIEDKQKAGDSVRSKASLGNFLAARVEISPPGLVERKKDDTGIGEKNRGNVLSLGISYARNRGFDVDTDNNTNNGYEVKDEKGTVMGADVFGRFRLGPGILSAQAEYVSMRYSKRNREERGWYVQAGYLFRTPFGELEPAFRYETQDIKYKNHKRKITTFGFNHYIKGHKVKWAYNLLLINNSWKDNQRVHQVQAQFYF